MSEVLHITVAVPANKLGVLYATLGALLGGTALAAVSAATTISGSGNAPALNLTGASDAPSPVAAADTASAVLGATEASSGEVDSAGTPYDPARHAGSKGKTKDGLWRMKVGVSRPDHEGKPAETATGAGSTASATAGAGTNAPVAAAEEDEFAAWAEAAGGATTARTWADADLSKLCNQAAQKAGGPGPVKELIAQYVPAGEQQHSKSIPADKREDFAKAVEAKLGFTYEG